jgi:hypothetical protein
VSITTTRPIADSLAEHSLRLCIFASLRRCVFAGKGCNRANKISRKDAKITNLLRRQGSAANSRTCARTVPPSVARL